MEEQKRRPKLWNRILVIVLILIGLVWFKNASSDKDWLWFLPVFDEQASKIHLYRDGEHVVLYPGDAGYKEVNSAVNQIVRHVQGKKSYNMSAEYQQAIYDTYSAVEVCYTEPVIIHTSHSFPKADKYLFPQSGHLYDPPMVFAGMQDRPNYQIGALVLSSRDALDEAVERVWAIHQEK